jgi:hypothetical protein
MMTGTHQVCANRLERDDSDHRRQAQHWHVARHLVSRVQGKQTFKKSGCHNSRRENVMNLGLTTRS